MVRRSGVIDYAAAAAHAARRALPALCEGRPGAARSGGTVPPLERRPARTPQLAGRRLRDRNAPVRGDDGELRLSAGRGGSQSRGLCARPHGRRLAPIRAAREGIDAGGRTRQAVLDCVQHGGIRGTARVAVAAVSELASYFGYSFLP